MLRLNRVTSAKLLDLEKMVITYAEEMHEIVVLIYQNKVKHYYFELDSLSSFLTKSSNGHQLEQPISHYVSKNRVFSLCSLVAYYGESSLDCDALGINNESNFCDLAGVVNLVHALSSTETIALADWLRSTVNALPKKCLLSQVSFSARLPRLRFSEDKPESSLLSGYVYFASSVRETDFKIGVAFDLLDEIYRLNYGRLTDPLRYEYVFECRNRFLIFEYVKIAFIVNELRNDFFVIKNPNVKIPFVVGKIIERYDI